MFPFRPPPDEIKSMFNAEIGIQGVTTSAGNTFGTSIIDTSLIGIGSNSFVDMMVILYPGQPRKVAAAIISGFDNTGGELTFSPAYKGIAAAIPAGVPYTCVPGAGVALNIAALAAIQAKILSDGTPFAGANIDDKISSRAAPGDAMDLVTDTINALLLAISTRAAPGAAMDLLAGTLTAIKDKILSDGIPFAGADIKELLQQLTGTVGTWIGPPGFCEALVFDGTYIYAGINASPAVVVKINPATMETVATLVGMLPFEEFCTSLASDGTYLYAGFNPIILPDTKAKAVKIDPTTMTRVGVPPLCWYFGTGPGRACKALAQDGTYLYTALNKAATPAWVAKVITDPFGGTHQVWEGAAGQIECMALAYHSSFLYAALATSPAQVVKIDPNTPGDMTTVAIWTGAAGQNGGLSLVYAGGYIYVGLGTNPVQVVKIDPATMDTVDTWIGPPGIGCYALAFDGSYIYAGLSTSPAQVVKIDPNTMETVATWTAGNLGQNNCWALASDGSYIYAGILTILAQVIQIASWLVK
jgi:hypothetical protein